MSFGLACTVKYLFQEVRLTLCISIGNCSLTYGTEVQILAQTLTPPSNSGLYRTRPRSDPVISFSPQSMLHNLYNGAAHAPLPQYHDIFQMCTTDQLAPDQFLRHLCVHTFFRMRTYS